MALTEGQSTQSEAKENTIVYDYHWYCYVELVLLFIRKLKTWGN